MITKEVYKEQVALLNRWKSMYYEKKQEIERLNNIINKAIEFLHNNTMIGHCKEHYELLEILGGK